MLLAISCLRTAISEDAESFAEEREVLASDTCAHSSTSVSPIACFDTTDSISCFCNAAMLRWRPALSSLMLWLAASVCFSADSRVLNLSWALSY